MILEKNTIIKRLVSLDLLKAYGILMMVQGHTLDAILNATSKATGVYHFLTYLRGFTAPVFLFAAGIGFMISMSRRKDDAPLKNFFIRLKHLIPIIAFGYFLHLPFFSLYKVLFRTTPAEVAQLFISDILQVIGFTIIGLQIVSIFIKKPSGLALFSGGATILCFVLTPFFGLIKYPNDIPIFIFQLLSRAGGSLFPMFPFSVYLLVGVIARYFVVSPVRGHAFKGEASFMKTEKSEFNTSTLKSKRSSNGVNKTKYYALLVGLFLLSIGWALGRLGHTDNRLGQLFYLHGSLVSQRVGGVILLWAIFMFFDNAKGWLVRVLTDIGKASFLIYVVHIMIVFGSVANKDLNLKNPWGGNLGFGPATLIALIVVLTMCLLGILWIRAKEKYPFYAKWARNGIWLLILGLFLFRPY